MTGPPADLLELYLLGELPPDQAAAVEAWLAEDAGAPAALDAVRRQLTRLDAVLKPPDGADELAVRIIASLPTGPGRGRASRPWVTGLAAAAAVLVAVGLWLFNRPGPPSTPTDSPEGWQVHAAEGAEYRIIDDGRIRLERGELFVEAGEQAPELTVEMPDATATTAGERFYIATHELEPSDPKRRNEPVKRFTRVLVLSGLVTLTTALGTVAGPANHLLVAETNKAPVDHAVTANSDFAFDLYRQLAGENPGDNLFFSPYSVSAALTMVFEGARSETAAEMGKVLRFPEAARRVGRDAQQIPFNASLLHTGQAALHERFNAANDAVPKAVRDRIATLRRDLDQANRLAETAIKAGKWQDHEAAAQKSQKLAAELNGLLAGVDQYEIRVANALWGEKSYPFRKPYLDTVNKFYRTGGLIPVDFRNDFEAARQRINGWVEEQTANRIKDLIPQNALDENAKRRVKLILTNAIYFKGEWAEVFDARATRDQDFTLADDKKVKVPMMNKQMGSARYGAFKADGTFFDTPRMIEFGEKDEKKLYPDARGFEVLEMPYKGGELAMVFVVPRSADGLAAVEKQLTPADLQAWLGKLQQRAVEVHVPRFKIETKYAMEKSLKAMGMKRAFIDPREPDGAQLDGISDTDDPEQKLYILKVLHKAFLEVNEKGTEAAAATAIITATPTAAPVLVPFTPTFKAERPFVCVIRDRKTGTLLFMGRVTNPKG